TATVPPRTRSARGYRVMTLRVHRVLMKGDGQLDQEGPQLAGEGRLLGRRGGGRWAGRCRHRSKVALAARIEVTNTEAPRGNPLALLRLCAYASVRLCVCASRC